MRTIKKRNQRKKIKCIHNILIIISHFEDFRTIIGKKKAGIGGVEVYIGFNKSALTI